MLRIERLQRHNEAVPPSGEQKARRPPQRLQSADLSMARVPSMTRTLSGSGKEQWVEPSEARDEFDDDDAAYHVAVENAKSENNMSPYMMSPASRGSSSSSSPRWSPTGRKRVGGLPTSPASKQSPAQRNRMQARFSFGLNRSPCRRESGSVPLMMPPSPSRSSRPNQLMPPSPSRSGIAVPPPPSSWKNGSIPVPSTTLQADTAKQANLDQRRRISQQLFREQATLSEEPDETSSEVVSSARSKADLRRRSQRQSYAYNRARTSTNGSTNGHDAPKEADKEEQGWLGDVGDWGFKKLDNWRASISSSLSSEESAESYFTSALAVVGLAEDPDEASPSSGSRAAQHWQRSEDAQLPVSPSNGRRALEEWLLRHREEQKKNSWMLQSPLNKVFGSSPDWDGLEYYDNEDSWSYDGFDWLKGLRGQTASRHRSIFSFLPMDGDSSESELDDGREHLVKFGLRTEQMMRSYSWSSDISDASHWSQASDMPPESLRPLLQGGNLKTCLREPATFFEAPWPEDDPHLLTLPACYMGALEEEGEEWQDGDEEEESEGGSDDSV